MADRTVRRFPQLSERPYDPRDGRWEVAPSAYRVVFWGEAGAGVRLADGTPMASAHGVELEGAADVTDVLAWAAARAEGRAYTVSAVVDTTVGGGGIVHLYGIDPTHITS